jgi:hypothetical protein
MCLLLSSFPQDTSTKIAIMILTVTVNIDKILDCSHKQLQSKLYQNDVSKRRSGSREIANRQIEYLHKHSNNNEERL